MSISFWHLGLNLLPVCAMPVRARGLIGSMFERVWLCLSALKNIWNHMPLNYLQMILNLNIWAQPGSRSDLRVIRGSERARLGATCSTQSCPLRPHGALPGRPSWSLGHLLWPSEQVVNNPGPLGKVLVLFIPVLYLVLGPWFSSFIKEPPHLSLAWWAGITQGQGSAGPPDQSLGTPPHQNWVISIPFSCAHHPLRAIQAPDQVSLNSKFGLYPGWVYPALVLKSPVLGAVHTVIKSQGTLWPRTTRGDRSPSHLIERWIYPEGWTLDTFSGVVPAQLLGITTDHENRLCNPSPHRDSWRKGYGEAEICIFSKAWGNCDFSQTDVQESLLCHMPPHSGPPLC